MNVIGIIIRSGFVRLSAEMQFLWSPVDRKLNIILRVNDDTKNIFKMIAGRNNTKS